MESVDVKMQETNISELFKNFSRVQMNRITFNELKCETSFSKAERLF